jgi:tRNA threonylcarbamoyl adenosine modification protein YjeE
MFRVGRETPQTADKLTPKASSAPEETEVLGRRLASDLRPGDLLLLYGSIGAGKSVLARGIAFGLGAAGWKGSPTFTLVNEYDTLPPLYHVDLYRISEPEVENVGLEEYIRADSIAMVEWADRAAGYLRAMAWRQPIEIEIEDLGGDDRLISVRQDEGGTKGRESS